MSFPGYFILLWKVGNHDKLSNNSVSAGHRFANSNIWAVIPLS